MSGTDTQGGMALAGTTAGSAAKKFGEKAADRGLNAIVDFVKGKYGEARVKIGIAFERYLENAALRIAIGNPLRLSLDFPPLHTGHEPFSSSGVPSLKTRFLNLMNYYCKLRLT